MAHFAHTQVSQAVFASLMEGNARFAAGMPSHPHLSSSRRRELLSGQSPQATVLSCSDSRVPTEILFDQGLGDIFTVRTAGEILDTAVVASLEYAVEGLGVDLLMVLGHEDCGTVAATLKTLKGHVEMSGAQGTILEQVGLSLRECQVEGKASAEAIERHHAQRMMEQLLLRSRVINEAVATGTLGLAVGRYVATTGEVEVLG